MFKFLKVEVVHWDYWERFTLPLRGNVITIVGPNGSGKTTLLDALRTLLCIDCSGGRDYKRYVRRNDKPLCWLRAVVDNERQESGSRPFFPVLSEKVTLACQIRKKGGDWQRQYLVTEGDVPIEKLEEHGGWVGVRDYRQRLENAGLTQAIRHVLSLEQGDTDKLCEYSPRQLLELVFSVFGDKEVLDNYQQAKSEQQEIGRELEKLEEDLSRLGLRLREAEARLNSFLEWKGISKELDRLSVETLARAELADIHEKIAATRTQMLKKRSDLKVRQHAVDRLSARNSDLKTALDAARVREEELGRAGEEAQEAFTRHRDAARDAEKILREKSALEELCRRQEEGVDTPALAAEQREKQGKQAANDYELESIRRQMRDLKGRIAARKAGQKLEPEFVQQFRRSLDQAGIGHCLLTDIVEVTDPGWQKALEGVLGPYAHIVLLADPNDRKRAWELGEQQRYRNFVVAQRSAPAAVKPGTLLEIASFSQTPPDWLTELLNRVMRVESVQEGALHSGDISWVTREGYHREHRGGRYIGVDAHKYQFGEAARKNLIAEEEKELTRLLDREEELMRENEALGRRIAEVQALFAGIDAARQLAARSTEFARTEKVFPLLAERAREAASLLSAGGAKLKQARDECHALDKERGILSERVRTDENSLNHDYGEYRNQKRQQAERILDFRGRRRPMPPQWYSRSAIAALRGEFRSADEVQREINRLKERLAQGSWVTDEQVVAVRDKLEVDHSHLEETIKARRIHHHRHLKATEEARESYINVLRATVRRYGRNVRGLGDMAGIGIEMEPPHLVNEDVALAQAGLNVKFDFDRKGMIGLNDGEASGGQQVMKSLILLVGLLMDETRPGGFVFIDEPFAHLDVFNIDKVGAFLNATKAQYVLTTPNTHNVNVFKTSDLTLVTQKRRHPAKWAPPVAFLLREKPQKQEKRK